MASQDSLWSQSSLKKPTSQCSLSKSRDLSLLRLPIETTVTGLKQAFSVLVNGHQDVTDLLVNEANVIYECRSCLNLFRCITSFVSHKRSFCPKRSSIISNFPRENGTSVPPVVVAQVSTQNVVRLVQEPEDLGLKIPEFDLNDYSPSLELLKDLDILKQTGVKKSLETIVQSIHSVGKNNVHNQHFKQKLESPNTQPAKKLNFAEFYQKRCNPKSKTAVLDPSGNIIQLGPIGKQFLQNMTLYKDEVKRNSTTSFNIFPCPKCERYFSSVKRTRGHLSTAHFFTRRNLDSHNQWILDNKQQCFKATQNDNHEALTKQLYAVNIRRDPSIEGSAELKNLMTSNSGEEKHIEELPLRPWAKLFHSNKSPQWQQISPTFEMSTTENIQNPSILKAITLPERRESAVSNGSENLNSATTSTITFYTLTNPPSPTSVLEKLSENKSVKPNEELKGHTCGRLQILPNNQHFVNDESKFISLSFLSDKTEQVIMNGEHSESRKSKRKQTNPTSVLRSKNPVQEVQASLSHPRKRFKPTHTPPFVEIKQVQVYPDLD